MRTPSRLMPPCPPPKLGVLAGLALIAILGVLVVLAVQATFVQLAISAGLIAALWVWAAFAVRRTKRNFQALASSRQGESICNFARSFDRRTVDTWVIRAVYEELQRTVPHEDFPIRSSDLLEKELLVDTDDLDMLLVPAISARTGRTLDDVETNPYWGKVHTVFDLVMFFNGQPAGGDRLQGRMA